VLAQVGAPLALSIIVHCAIFITPLFWTI